MAKNPESPNPMATGTDSAPAKSNGAPAPAAAESHDARAGRSTAPQSNSNSTTQNRTLGQRKGQYLVAARRSPGLQAMGLQPLQFNVIEQTLKANTDIDIVDIVGPRNTMGALADGMSEVPSVLVVRMTDQKAGQLHQQAMGRLIVEPDHPLTMTDAAVPLPPLVGWSVPTSGASLNVTFTLLGKNDVPVADAEVYLFGSLLPANGTTGANGQVSLSLYGETPQSVRGLYIKPKGDYWSYYQKDPDISADQPNVVGLRALSDWPSLPNFPAQQAFGWGQKSMRLDQLPDNYRGQGVRVAVIDSGIDNKHDDLKKVRFGFDIINKKTSPDTWNDDTVSHGTHCAGVITGADNAIGIRGFAPDAEVHACKLFPGGQISQLIDALEYCIEKQVDVVNLSLGGSDPSEALEQQIARAKQAGIACIVAAGNSGGPVQYPASSPNVLAVAALGKLNEFPPDSYHTQTVTQLVDANGFFSPKFTCFGPQVAVCAPGVAITSSVPSNNYAVWDGTSMAAPHITGLAALVLAHHPDFQTTFKARSPERVERLFQIIKASAQPINFGDPGRSGLGLPDVLMAVGLQPQRGMPIGMTRPYFAAAPSQPLGGSMAGAALSGGAPTPQAFAPASLDPMMAAYIDQSQRSQASWFNPPWAAFGQPIPSPILGGGNPGYAACYGRPQGGMPFGF